jgi:hypothetical protein
MPVGLLSKQATIFGLILREMRKDYTESRRRRISYIQ